MGRPSLFRAGRTWLPPLGVLPRGSSPPRSLSRASCALLAAFAARSLGSNPSSPYKKDWGASWDAPVFFGLDGFEPSISWSRTKRASPCATARKKTPSCDGASGATGLEPAISGLTGRRDKPASPRPRVVTDEKRVCRGRALLSSAPTLSFHLRDGLVSWVGLRKVNSTKATRAKTMR